MKNFANMLKQAQELQGRMAEMQAQLENLVVEGSAGGDMVKVTLSGKGDLRQVHIDPSMAGEDDVEILEDLIVAAHAEAKRRLEEALQERMKEVTGGMPMPPGFGV